MTFNQEEYTRLFSEIVIKPIESDEELDKYVKLVEPYFFDSEKTPEEVAIYNLLIILIVEYERENCPEPELEPLELLKSLMEDCEMTFEDLVSVVGNRNLAHLLLNGVLEIDKPLAKILGNFFSINYKNFL